MKIDSFPQSTTHAIHSITRYIDEIHILWETAQTYTGKLVVRSGPIEADGVTVNWSAWVTQDDVEMRRTNAKNEPPRQRSRGQKVNSSA